MAFEIEIHVNKNGKLETENSPLELSVYKESKRVKLKFTVDEEIDSEYHYLKFSHVRTSYLYRVHNNEFIIPKAVTAYEGRWEVSFICCDEPATSQSKIEADYIYASEPIVADVVKGNLDYTVQTEEQKFIRELCEGVFTHFEVPGDVETLTSYLLSNLTHEFDVFISASVKTIKDHIFYQSGCSKITFEEGSQLTTLEENALYRIESLGDIKFPATLSNWGKYNLSYCGCPKVEFGSNSKLKSLTSYALWNVTGLKVLYLPDHLESFTGGTAVIKSCPALEEVRFPNTLTTTIPANSIQDCPNIQRIVLQSNFNVSANFSNCTNLTHDAIVSMFGALKNLTGTASKVLTIGATNLAKVTETEQQIALDKNWSLA